MGLISMLLGIAALDAAEYIATDGKKGDIYPKELKRYVNKKNKQVKNKVKETLLEKAQVRKIVLVKSFPIEKNETTIKDIHGKILYRLQITNNREQYKLLDKDRNEIALIIGDIERSRVYSDNKSIGKMTYEVDFKALYYKASWIPWILKSNITDSKYSITDGNIEIAEIQMNMISNNRFVIFIDNKDNIEDVLMLLLKENKKNLRKKRK